MFGSQHVRWYAADDLPRDVLRKLSGYHVGKPVHQGGTMIEKATAMECRHYNALSCYITTLLFDSSVGRINRETLWGVWHCRVWGLARCAGYLMRSSSAFVYQLPAATILDIAAHDIPLPILLAHFCAWPAKRQRDMVEFRIWLNSIFSKLLPILEAGGTRICYTEYKREPRRLDSFT